jgi:hypothetical protein
VGTGTGAGGSLIFQTAPAGGSGSAQNALVTALTLNSAGVATFASNIVTASTAALVYGTRGRIEVTADGVMVLKNNAQTDFGRLMFGGSTSSFPAIKRSTTVLQARLADDSAFGFFQGKIQTDANAATETITPDKTLTLYDAAGVAYKVPCVAA